MYEARKRKTPPLERNTKFANTLNDLNEFYKIEGEEESTNSKIHETTQTSAVLKSGMKENEK